MSVKMILCKDKMPELIHEFHDDYMEDDGYLISHMESDPVLIETDIHTFHVGQYYRYEYSDGVIETGFDLDYDGFIDVSPCDIMEDHVVAWSPIEVDK